MTNADSYRMMEALRTHLKVNVYEVNSGYEVVISFRTVDGKIHQVCNSFVDKVEKIPALLRSKDA